MRGLWCLALLCFLAACSGSRGASSEPEAPEETGVRLADVEDFDPAPYRDLPPETNAEEVVHDVPAALMENRADAGLAEVVSGFRIQIFQALRKEEAISREEEARAWWRDLYRRGRFERLFPEAPDAFPEDVPTYVQYRQPYYRVRIGDFLDRALADSVLQKVVVFKYPGAFVAPDEITVMR